MLIELHTLWNYKLISSLWNIDAMKIPRWSDFEKPSVEEGKMISLLKESKKG